MGWLFTNGRACVMEIQQLRHLLAAVQHGNLLKAAEESNISQSGLSRSIKSLEDRLGVPLLLRKPKGVEPTVYGISVLRRAKVILNEVQKSVQEVRAIEQARVGEVTFGITQNYAHYMVPDMLIDLARDRPDLNVRVVTSGFVELINMIKTEALDFGFGLIGHMEESDDIVVEPLRNHQSQVIANPDHELVRRGYASIRDLSSARWAMLASEGLQRGFVSFFEGRGIPVPTQSLKTDSIALLRRVVPQMDVLTILPKDAVAQDIADGRLAIVECDTPVENTRVGLFFRGGGMVTPQAQLVIDRFRVALGGTPSRKMR